MLLNQKIPPRGVAANKLKALIFDWAGTAVDFGSLAPVRTLQHVFECFGVPISESEARRDMGLPKRDHIARILALGRIQVAWSAAHGTIPGPTDLTAVYERFIPLQFECLIEYSTVIEGVAQSIERARQRGLRIGSTTGYTRAMLDLLLTSAARQGFAPDCSVSSEDVGVGRPQPFMIFQNAVRLHIYPLSAIAKIGDTIADIEEGLNAGVWSIGVVKTGNMIGLSRQDWEALPEADRRERLRLGRRKLEEAGAHYVIDTLDKLNSVLDDIDSRLRIAAER